MKKLITILIFISATICVFPQGYVLDNSGGKIQNSGTIRVKSGQVKSLPDTLGGRMEFLGRNDASQQLIPNIVYNQLVLKNQSKKIVGDEEKTNGETRNLTVLDSLIMEDSTLFTTFWLGIQPADVHAKASVRNTATYRGTKYVVMNSEESSQDLDGNGSFSRLKIDNPLGVDVINGGGFDIRESLVLRQGELRNSTENNFKLADSSEIVRYTGASLANVPQFGSNISVRYRGSGEMTASNEMPKDSATIRTLDVENTGGISLSRNVTANDSIIVKGDIRTSSDTLTLTSNNDPIFSDDMESEIHGTFRRNHIESGDTLIFNNPYTYAYFRDSIALKAIRDFAMTVTPGEYPQLPQGQDKVLRALTLMAWDSEGNNIDQGLNMDFGYGWRHKPGQAEDESNDLPIEDIVLQRWIGNSWYDYEGDPAYVDNYGWAYNDMPDITKLGTFGLGLPGYVTLMFAAKILLEGPYAPGSGGFMYTDLLDRGRLDKAPSKDQYPLNLDPNYDPDNFTTVPDSVVDWIVVELRKERNSDAIAYKTGFLRYDGKILDMDGNDALSLSRYDGLDSGGGAYYVVIRHRNHNPIITENTVNIYPENNSDTLDFTNTSIVEGGTAAMKLLEIAADGKRIWGLRGGYYVDDTKDALDRMIGVFNEKTNDRDHRAAWHLFTEEGYLLEDYNLDGIVTTRDFNISWNNRKID